ncbi:hypothetical protein [Prochlorococcus marinus]|uniref:Uncharacterized protein n=1 Tax=Prochlorococcus marinus (strain MIT 9303) TaxID=59922 RepID=A2CDW8_PROM3|nr:hypothetical protein [Prochlorococcus marinus]ABM79678.1 Hypothetical protein P9303_29481 [Prochlorococcus marinus str. MIT 9303]
MSEHSDLSDQTINTQGAIILALLMPLPGFGYMKVPTTARHISGQVIASIASAIGEVSDGLGRNTVMIVQSADASRRCPAAS